MNERISAQSSRRLWIAFMAFMCGNLLLSTSLAIAAEQPVAVTSPLSFIESGHFKRARALVEQRYRANPGDPETLWLMSQLKQEYHDLNSALDFAERALAANPQNSRYHLRVAMAAGEMAEKASFLRQISLGRRFKKEIDAAIALDPNNVDALLLLMEYYLQAPSIIGGDKTKAHAIPDRILRIDPVQGCFARVRIANYDKQWNLVEEFYLQAIQAKPGSYSAHQVLADYYSQRLAFEKGEKYAREAIRIDPGRAAAHISLARLLVEQKKWPELELALKEAEEAVPDNLTPCYSAAALSCWRNYGLPCAADYLKKYLSQEPEPDMPPHADAHRLLGHIWYATGHKAEGIAELQLAVRLNPNSPAKEELKKMK
jgi:tetratricopeptide (TPR) repeat protein